MIGSVALAALCINPLLSSPPQAVPELSVDVERCPAFPRDELLRLTALELDARVAGPGEALAHAVQTRVVCAGPAVELTVQDPVTGKRLLRTITIGPREASVALRLVALAVTELVITSWMELTLPEAARAPLASTRITDPGSAPSPALMQAAKERALLRAPTQLALEYVLVLGQAIGPFNGLGLGWGAGLRLGWALERPAPVAAAVLPVVDLEIGGAWTDVRGTPGTVEVSLGSAALRGAVRVRRRGFWLDAGGGGRFGFARLQGIPADALSTRGATVAGAWAGPLAYVGVGVRIRRMVVATGIEAGYVLREVTGDVDQNTQIAVARGWLVGTVAIGWGG